MTDTFRALCAELIALLDCFGSTFNIPIEAIRSTNLCYSGVA